MATLVETIDLTKSYKPSQIWILSDLKSVKAVDKVSFKIEEGQIYGLVGESGCGKTTIGRLILRLIEPTAGQVWFDGKNVMEFKSAEMKEYRRNAQIIFQNPFSSMNPRRTIFNSLSVGFDNYGMGTRTERKQWLEELMQRVGLEPDFLARYPHQFSGGQLQRIVVARALSLKPRFIVADEPVASLDVSIQAQVVNLLEDLQGQFNLTYLFIAHDLSMVRHISSRVAVMYLGIIVEIADRVDLYANPLHPYTQALLSAVPIPDPVTDAKRKRRVLEGDVPSPVNPPSGCRFRTRCWLAEKICEEQRPEFREITRDHYVACHMV